MVKVSNPLGEDVQRTARRQSPYHGYGLTILNSIAEKYSGEMSVEKNTVQYTAEIKLKLRQGEEESENEDSDCG